MKNVRRVIENYVAARNGEEKPNLENAYESIELIAKRERFYDFYNQWRKAVM